MPAFARLTLALAFALAPAALFAASAYVPLEQQLTPEQRRDTGLDTLSPAQLELLDRLLREKAEHATVQAPAEAAQPSAVAAGTATAVASDSPAAGAETPRAVLMELEIRTIKSRLKGTITGWAPGTEFVLENGQRWKVLKGEIQLRKPVESPEILVVPGMAGRWFLQVDEDYPKARVYRID